MDVALSLGPSNLQDYINKKDSELLKKYFYLFDCIYMVSWYERSLETTKYKPVSSAF